MKRIDYIVQNKKGILKDDYQFREKKIRRTLEDAIDYADEKAYDSNRKAVEIINGLKDAADDKDAITNELNRYIDAKESAEGYLRSKKYLEEVKKLLEEEVNFEEAQLIGVVV